MGQRSAQRRHRGQMERHVVDRLRIGPALEEHDSFPTTIPPSKSKRLRKPIFSIHQAALRLGSRTASPKCPTVPSFQDISFSYPKGSRMRKTSFVALLVIAAAFTAGGVQAQAPAVINLIQLPADNSAEVYYAQDLGYFKDAGLDVRVTSMTNSGAIIAARAGGAGDIGNSVIGSAAQAREKGIPVRFIAPAGLYVDATPTSALFVAKDSPIKTAADLEGKTVAVSGLNDLTYYATRAWIDKHGGDSSKVKYVELPFPAMNAAVEQHRVDAVYNIEPFMTAAAGELRILG